MRFPLASLWFLLAPIPVAADAPVPEPPPPPMAGTVELTAGNLSPVPQLRRFRANLAPDPEAVERPPIDPANTGTEARLLRTWLAEGSATGLAGVFYDNRDRGHSRLAPTRFPQLDFVVYEAGLAERGFDRSLAEQVLFPAPTLGNASLAVTSGALARSLPRLAMTSTDSPAQAFIGYVNNHLYVYPAHRDIGDLDLLPAALPYFVPSVGSSHTDRPFLDALALTLASFRPETRRRLEEEGLLAATLTMLLRRTQSGVTDYATPTAHPPAFERGRLRPVAMMTAANAMTPDEIPPLVVLQVESETFAEAADLVGFDERLFDTPSAIARVWRGWDWQREMVLSAAATRDPNGRDLSFRWVLLSGDPERVSIEPLDEASSRVRLTVDWHDAPFAPFPGSRPSARVEVAALAWNGAQWSAPAMVTVVFPTHEARSWAPGPDGAPLLAAIDYTARAEGFTVDPAIWWQADWRDEALRDADGTLLGWRRHRAEVAQDVPLGDLAEVQRIERLPDGRVLLVWDAP